MPTILGEDLLARDETGRPRVRIATVFPRADTIVTLPGIHATQRVAFVDWLNSRRESEGLPPLTDAEEEREYDLAVDVVLDDDTVLIRPDPADMPLAFEADELLQQILSKKSIKFLHVLNPQVRDAIQKRGERWRISPVPRSAEEMRRMIAGCRIGIAGREIYYYNRTTGTRYLTYQDFCGLAKFDDTELRQHLSEIVHHHLQCNRLGNREVDFFMADPPPTHALDDPRFNSDDSAVLRAGYEALRQRFHDAVKPEFQHDDPLQDEWRCKMFAALSERTDKEVSEESSLGLSAEFFMQIRWLPGARIEEGELLMDPVIEEEAADHVPHDHRISDELARGFIFNFLREYGDLEYINIGLVPGTLSKRASTGGFRGVYLAEVKQLGVERAVLRIIRMQKWGVREHLDEGKDLLTSILEAEQYTQYIMDRRLACRQLGMNLTARVTSRKVAECYNGHNGHRDGKWIWTTYFERDYVPGLATDKVDPCRFEHDAFASQLARLLGRAAAPNIIVGRTDPKGNVIFDDGDEVVVESRLGIPVEVVIADHTGTFSDFRTPLENFAPAYANAVNKRRCCLQNVDSFTDAYLSAFIDRFHHIQNEYRKRKRSFDTLFKHLERDEAGSFAFRWERVLARLESASAEKLADAIRSHILKN